MRPLRRLLCLLFPVLFISLHLPCSAATSVAYSKVKKAGVWLNIVTVDLNDGNICVTPAVSKWGIGGSESFRSMLRRTRPAAAIDGTFFCTRSLRPTGDIVIDGRLISRGCLGVAVGISSYRYINFVPSRHPNMYRWTDYDNVMVAGPTLITQGKISVVPWAEGFRSGVHFSKRIRAAVGLTSANKLILATTTRGVYLRQLARAMRSLKCIEAAGLDGGSSTGLYCKGRLITNPRRGMTNCLLVYDNPYIFEQHRSAFYPEAIYSAKPSGSVLEPLKRMILLQM